MSATPAAATPVLALEAGTGAPASSVASAPLAVKQEQQKPIDHGNDDASRSTKAIVDYVADEDSESYKARLAEGKSRQP